MQLTMVICYLIAAHFLPRNKVSKRRSRSEKSIKDERTEERHWHFVFFHLLVKKQPDKRNQRNKQGWVYVVNHIVLLHKFG